MTCPSCGAENGAGARFCMACGTPLAAALEAARELAERVAGDVQEDAVHIEMTVVAFVVVIAVRV